MMFNNFLTGAGTSLLLISLFADLIGVGGNPSFGAEQTTGAIAGVAVIAIGVYLARRTKQPSDQ